MRWEHYRGMNFPYKENTPIKRKYSITADVLSYQLCPQQYALYRIRKYEASMTNQLFYGTVIHQVLDRAHMHFKDSWSPQTPGHIPTDEDIESYFSEVVKSLRARRISAGDKVRDQALEIVKRFNRIEGPTLYPRIVNTECRLQTDKSDYILSGNVDVLATSLDNPASVEIWDYKGAYLPSRGEPQYQQYIYQMKVYAELYRRQTGVMPTKAVLYFMNSLSGSIVPTGRPRNAILEVPLDAISVDIAMDNFSVTVSEIETARNSGNWPSPTTTPPRETCNICDKRWNCPHSGQKYQMRHP